MKGRRTSSRLNSLPLEEAGARPDEESVFPNVFWRPGADRAYGRKVQVLHSSYLHAWARLSLNDWIKCALN